MTQKRWYRPLPGVGLGKSVVGSLLFFTLNLSVRCGVEWSQPACLSPSENCQHLVWLTAHSETTSQVSQEMLKTLP